MTIQKCAEAILKILYEYFHKQNPKGFLSVEEIFGRLKEEIPDVEQDAGLEYLLEKGWIKETVDEKTGIEAYKINAEGVDYYESITFSHYKDSPGVSFQGSLTGTLIIIQPYGQNHDNDQASHGQQNIYNGGKEFMDHYDDILHFIDYMRNLAKKTSLPSEIEIDLREQCEAVEEVVRSRTFSIGHENQKNEVRQFVDYAKRVPDQVSITSDIQKELMDQCQILETMLK
ncbi:MAG: hypothetical protein IEMM0008_1377 [bacterium]|nr:MAG: hypothetical protein IEMM0008_1377 [bacterium]